LQDSSPTGAPIVDFADVSFRWPGRDGFALQIDRFSLPAGRRILLLGPSGSGKSTFLSLLTGIVVPQQGSVNVLGTNLAKLSSGQRDRFRAEHFGVIFQMFNLLPYGSVLDNVLLPLSFARERRRRVETVCPPEQEAQRLLGRLGLEPAIIAGRSAARLSVGQQQRVAAARALIGRPEVVVADEPTSALDRNRQIAFLNLLFEEVLAAGSTLVMVSHDESLGPRFDEVIPLGDFVRTVEEAA
jgi:putative ABC transport system ATP-binding protein